MITVLLAARTSAKQVAKVSPIAAVSGNSESVKVVHSSICTGFFRIEMALGIHHAIAAKKSLFLMPGSFALSIILFLNFSIQIDFVDHLRPQSATASDIDILSSDGANSIDSALAQILNASWSLPIGALAIIVLFVIASAVIAAYSPVKRMQTISVTDTINEL